MLSLKRLGTCHFELQRLMHAVMNEQIMDFSILCGFRDKHDQNEAVKRGNSKLCWPHGRHNHLPSLAVDIAAYPIDKFNKDNTERTIALSKIVLKKAKELKIPVFWGGHWTHLDDIYHFQLPEYYKDVNNVSKDDVENVDVTIPFYDDGGKLKFWKYNGPRPKPVRLLSEFKLFTGHKK